jgi:hypothetical protein
VCIGTADTFWALCSNFARPHVAVFAAGAGESESAMWFLGIKTIKGRFDTGLFHMEKHFTHCRVWGPLDYITFTREFCFSVHALPLSRDHA